jgi:hypothetical protein
MEKKVLILGEIVTIDSKSLDPNTEVMRLYPILQYSSIPTFHVNWTRPEYEKQAYFQ